MTINKLNLLINPKDVKSLRDITLESIRAAIIGGDLKPGQHLIERELAEAMGISTTPIKEAFRILGHEGLVETLPRKGTYVSEVVNSSIEEIMMLRAYVESLSARLAALKISQSELEALELQIGLMEGLVKNRNSVQLAIENTKFHLMIRNAAKNPVIFQMVAQVVSFDNAFRKRALEYTVEVEEGFFEHNKIFEAIKERNPDLAEERMKTHIMRTAQNVLNPQSHNN
jgi:DNA-binding GntR family transcriptional regulator